MLAKKNISEGMGEGFREVEEHVTNLYSSGNINKEVDISGALVSSLAWINWDSKIDRDDITANVRAFTVQDEPQSGADIGIRYQFGSAKFGVVRRGIIAQAKRYDMTHNDLSLQCHKMIARTEEAYLFIYSEEDINVVPAMPVLLDGGVGSRFTKYYKKAFTEFMREYVQGFHGEIPIAENIQEPSEISPVEERVKFLIDIKVTVGEEDDLELDFDRVNQDQFRRLRLKELGLDSWDDSWGGV
jgi:hypothetical protein